MQKIALSTLVREELTRALIFGVSFCAIVTVGGASIGYAANSGGIFGELLNKILVQPWDSTTNDGTVKNAMSLSGMTASQFVRTNANQSCPTNKCIVGFETDGKVKCN